MAEGAAAQRASCLYEVVGGKGSGGVLVRIGKDVKSKESPDGRLQTGSIVAELEGDGDRMRYTLLTGSGPKDGWVSMKFKSTKLLEVVGQEGTKAYAEEQQIAAIRSSAGGDRGRGRIWLMPQGTRGDNQPYLAVAVGLRQAGFRPRVLAGSGYRNFVESQGVDFTEVGVDCQKGMEDSLKKADVPKDAKSTAEMVKKLREEKIAAGENPDDIKVTDLQEGGEGQALGELFFSEEGIKESAKQMQAIMETERPDLILAHALQGVIPYIAWAKFGCPVVQMDFIPDMGMWNDENIKGNLERANETGKWIEEVIGVNPVDGVTHADVKKWAMTHQKCACEKSVVDSFEGLSDHPEYKEAVKGACVGCMILDLNTQLKDMTWFGGSENLLKMQSFLDAGTPPFYVGWGSMPIPVELGIKMVVTLRMNKHRAVICEGWSKLSFENFKEALLKQDPQDQMQLVPYAETNICWVKVAPHEWLFSRCCATIHHGGAGTTIAALRGGVPTCITPFGFDQIQYASWVKMNNWGSSFSLMSNPEKTMDPVWSKAMRVCATNKEMIAACKANGEALRKEDAVGGMVKFVEYLVEKQDELPETMKGSWGMRTKRE